MKWRLLELLRFVVECGNFEQAARAAGVSQPAISQAMQRLEQEVNEPLFERQGRKRQPTAKAIELANAMRTADERLRHSFSEHAAENTDPVVRTLRVGLAPVAGLLYGPTMVNALADTGKRTRLSIVTGSAPAMLNSVKLGELDLVIVPRPRGLNRSGFHEHLMFVSQPLIYCREGHGLAAATSLRQIARAHWVVAGQAGTPGNVIEEAFRVRRWPAPKIATQCADYAMLVQIVAHSDLLGIVPHPRLVPQAKRSGLVPIHVSEGLPHYDVCLFWSRHSASVDAPLQRIIEALVSLPRALATPDLAR